MLDQFGQRALGRIATLKIICDRIRSLAALGGSMDTMPDAPPGMPG